MKAENSWLFSTPISFQVHESNFIAKEDKRINWILNRVMLDSAMPKRLKRVFLEKKK